jgi:hypothetical protein
LLVNLGPARGISEARRATEGTKKIFDLIAI